MNTSTDTRIEIAVAQYAGATLDWRGLRLAVAGPRCRETGWYYYSRNGGTVQERSPGLVAWAVIHAARELGWSGSSPQSTGTWCSQWPRTQQTWREEQSGVDAIEDALIYVQVCSERRPRAA